MTIEIQKLPYEKDALEPFISEEVLFYHFEKHYKTYVNTANTLIAETALEELSLPEIILATKESPEHRKIYNNAAQCFNHTFYFQSLSPEKQEPSGTLKQAIERDFGSLENLKTAMKELGLAQFGSGWVWLVSDHKGVLSLMKTGNADNPLGERIPLLTLDVWEHAYYLDYHNRRGDYLSEVIENRLNWSFAEDNYLTVS
ncbi:MAG: superoxide dismutase [Alphaproteobacteria bacterium]|nr:superoxide dismutase [Alphaproteobacteria bacterium]